MGRGAQGTTHSAADPVSSSACDPVAKDCPALATFLPCAPPRLLGGEISISASPPPPTSPGGGSLLGPVPPPPPAGISSLASASSPSSRESNDGMVIRAAASMDGLVAAAGKLASRLGRPPKEACLPLPTPDAVRPRPSPRLGMSSASPSPAPAAPAVPALPAVAALVVSPLFDLEEGAWKGEGGTPVPGRSPKELSLRSKPGLWAVALRSPARGPSPKAWMGVPCRTGGPAAACIAGTAGPSPPGAAAAPASGVPGVPGVPGGVDTTPSPAKRCRISRWSGGVPSRCGGSSRLMAAAPAAAPGAPCCPAKPSPC